MAEIEEKMKKIVGKYDGIFWEEVVMEVLGCWDREKTQKGEKEIRVWGKKNSKPSPLKKI